MNTASSERDNGSEQEDVAEPPKLTDPKCYTCFRALEDFLRYPEEVKARKISGTVMVRFVIDTMGAVNEAEVVKGIGGGCDKVARYAVERTENWTPANYKGKKVKAEMTLPVTFSLNEQPMIKVEKDNKPITIAQKEAAREKKREEKRIVQKKCKKSEAVNGYVMKVSSLGWINLDRLQKFPPERLTRIKVENTYAYTPYTKLIFTGMKAMKGYRYNKKKKQIFFAEVPLGKEVILFDTRIQNGQPVFAFKRVKVKQDMEITFDNYEALALSQLKNRLNDLMGS